MTTTRSVRRAGAFIPACRDLDWGDEIPFVTANQVGFVEHPFPLDLDEIDLERARLREALERKRPCGFTAPWPERPGLRRAA